MFNLAEGAVVQHHGQDVWDQIVDAAGVAGAYTSLGTYPDDELAALIDAAAQRLGTDKQQVYRFVGQNSIVRMYARYPDFFDRVADLGELLRSLDSFIHVEVVKSHQGATTPTFEVAEVDGGFDVIYRSRRRMHALAAGLIEGTAIHYGTPVTIDIQPNPEGARMEVRYQ